MVVMFDGQFDELLISHLKEILKEIVVQIKIMESKDDQQFLSLTILFEQRHTRMYLIWGEWVRWGGGRDWGMGKG